MNFRNSFVVFVIAVLFHIAVSIAPRSDSSGAYQEEAYSIGQQEEEYFKNNLK